MIRWLRKRNRSSESNHIEKKSDISSSESESSPTNQVRSCRFEQMESRLVLSATPVEVGAVYIEDDSGTDGQADQFYVAFEGGSATTRLDRIVINTSQDGDDSVLSEPDVYFDTIDNQAPNNVRGSGGAQGFQFSTDSVGIVASDVTWQVTDGGTNIVIDIQDFQAGDKLVFSIDVDQFFSNKPDDQITSGIEFAGSKLETHFVDAHYNFDVAPTQFGGTFTYNYDFGSDDIADSGLISSLPSEQYRLSANNFESIENRTAGAYDRLTLTPKPVTISGTVFHDRDVDLVQDAGDEGIAGVELRLQKLNDQGQYVDIANGANSFTATVTDANGDYLFGTDLNLQPGTYRVIEIQPSDFEISVGEIPGTVEGTSIGTVDSTNVLSEIVIPLGDQHAIDYDFAEAKDAKLSGYVFHDRNNNGIRDAGEEGLEGVQIRVAAINSSFGQSPVVVTTDADGYYCVDGLTPGEYEILEIAQPSGYLDGLDSPGTIASNVVGNAINPGDHIVGVTLLSDQEGVEYNFGEIRFGSLSGYVFLGTPEGDCVGPGHPEYRPIANVEVQLQDTNGNTWTTTTDQNGRYEFLELAPGTYTIVEVTHPNFPYLNGDVHVGTIDGVETGSLSAVDTISGIEIGAGDNGVNYNFCEHEPATLAGNVFHDRNNDGIRDAGEEGIAGVEVQLFDDNGTFIRSTTTDALGAYSFTGLYAGQYCIKEIQPATYVDGIDQAGRIDGVTVGVADSAQDKIRDINLLGGQAGVNYDFGEYKLSTIEGVVHTDRNGDCTFDPSQGETPLVGVVIELVDSNGDVIESTTTDAQGKYRFEGIHPGTYSVRQQHPAGFFQGGQLVGVHHGNGLAGPGDASVADIISEISFVSDTHLSEYNFCELPPATLSGYVFKDGANIRVDEGTSLTPRQILNRRDGVLTADDQRLAGVTLELRHGITGLPISGDEALPGVYGSGPIRTVTDANGYYEFVGLPAGTYAVFEVQPGGYTDHVDTAGTTNGIPINASQNVSQFVLNRLDQSVEHRYDAILMIAVGVGDHSQFNNFSEVVIETVPDQPPFNPPPFELPEPIEPIPTTGFVPPPERLYAGQLPVRETSIPIYGASRDGIDYTWHLSVIDAGVPRGRGEVVANFDNPFQVVAFSNSRGWEDGAVDAGQWIICFNDCHQMSQPFDGKELGFGLAEGIPLVGDFNGDGVDEVAIYREGHWFIDLNGNGKWDEFDLWARLGNESDRPVVGDWDGDGKDDIGIFGPIWAGDPRAIEMEPGLPDSDNSHLTRAKNVPPLEGEATRGKRIMRLTSSGENRVDVIDHVFRYGDAPDTPIAGDWNGDGIRSIGIFNDGEWKLDVDGDGRWTEKDKAVTFGQAGDQPVIGDFNGDGIDELGVYRDGQWTLDSNGNHEMDAADAVFRMGEAADQPLVGDFDGDGIDEAIIYRPKN